MYDVGFSNCSNESVPWEIRLINAFVLLSFSRVDAPNGIISGSDEEIDDKDNEEEDDEEFVEKEGICDEYDHFIWCNRGIVRIGIS